MTIAYIIYFFIFFISQPIGYLSNFGLKKIIAEAEVKIKEFLEKSFKTGFFKSLIKFGTTYIGIAIVVFHIFGNTASIFIASIIFTFNIIWTFISFSKIFPYIKKIPKRLIQTKSLYKTTLYFLDDNWEAFFNEEEINKQSFFKKNFLKFLKRTTAKNIDTAYTNYKKIGSSFSSVFQELPDTRKIVHSILIFIAKFLMKYIIFFGLYFLILWLLQPIILENFAGITKMEIILFPFIQIKNAFVYLFHIVF